VQPFVQSMQFGATTPGSPATRGGVPHGSACAWNDGPSTPITAAKNALRIALMISLQIDELPRPGAGGEPGGFLRPVVHFVALFAAG
jgi:hypothetical protein